MLRKKVAGWLIYLGKALVSVSLLVLLSYGVTSSILAIVRAVEDVSHLQRAIECRR